MKVFSTRIGLVFVSGAIGLGGGASAIDGSLCPTTYPSVFLVPSTSSINALVRACSPLKATTFGGSPNIGCPGSISAISEAFTVLLRPS